MSLAAFAALFVAAPANALVLTTFTTIDAPGATNNITEAWGISDAGQVVGFGERLSPPGTPPDDGFLYSGGSFTTIDVPGAFRTQAHGINGAGQIVGFFGTSGAVASQHGFLYAGGSFTTLDVPGASFTQAFGINDAGQIVGYSVGG